MTVQNLLTKRGATLAFGQAEGQYGHVTGDSADVTMDPIVNLRDAHLIELYLHRCCTHRDDHLQALPDPPAQVTGSTPVDRRGPDSYP